MHVAVFFQKKYITLRCFSQGRRGEEGSHLFAIESPTGQADTWEATRNLTPRLGVRRSGRNEATDPRDSHDAL